ncbi:MAG: Inosine-5'-monophosphate dehydrogenase [Methanoregula sp. PtaU1.Bin051]|nr:MAG: Inosine-5'-monophosphate dehydrogenase [Methanoregula sp. PtaU1.Bin051]
MSLKAADIMSAPVRVVSPSDTIAHARRCMVRYRISRLLIVEDGALTGIVTKKDLAYRLRQSEPAWRRRPIDHIPVSVIAIPDPITVTPSTSVREIAALFVEHAISSVPVMGGDEVAGIITKSDLMRSASFQNLKGSVQDLMEDVVTVSRLHSLDHVIDVMSERNDKVVVTNNDGSIAGIITETNLAFLENGEQISGIAYKRVPVNRQKPFRAMRALVVGPVTAEDIMTSPIRTTAPETPLNRAIADMNRYGINSLVVVDDKDIVGIIKRDDIIMEVAK